MQASPKDDPQTSVLERANALLSAFGPRHRYLALSQIVLRTGLPKSTVHRTAQQMTKLGWLAYKDGRYSLGTRIFEFAGLSSVRHELREAALPFMEDLYELTHATVHLGVRDGLDVLYVEKIAGHDKVTDMSQVGGRMPSHCTALGKAILAFSTPGLVDEVVEKGLPAFTQSTITSPAKLRRELANIAQAGISFDREEASIGISCVAAPVFGRDGSVIAAISVTGRTGRNRPDRIAPAVMSAAGGATQSLVGIRSPGRGMRRVGVHS